MLIYIKSLNAKKTLPASLKEGRVYQAAIVDDWYQISDGDAEFFLQKGITDGEAFYAEVEELNPSNYRKFKYTKKDSQLVFETFEKDNIISQLEQLGTDVVDRIDREIEEGFDDLGELADVDPATFMAIAKVAKYINSTYKDKYESSNLPEIDLTGLMRNSKGGRFFNCGNAAKYLKRYMTDGYEKSNNPHDLLKACHYLVMEIDRRSNEE